MEFLRSTRLVHRRVRPRSGRQVAEFAWKIRTVPGPESCFSSRAGSPDIMHLPARVVVTAADRLTSADSVLSKNSIETRHCRARTRVYRVSRCE